MEFRILSHAGLEVRAGGKSLIFDPWLLGSTYWRSWWNYPPVARELIDGLKPDFLYLTHVHWDHFQGPSLRKFALNTPVFVPRGNARRMARDLAQIGFIDVREIRHGETVTLAPGFTLTSWQFYPFTDSAAVVEAEGITLFNSNDAKFMGRPLDQILRRHPRVDFVFRSHSSANPRLCFELTDAPGETPEDGTRYAADFADFAIRTGARYAVPFASNHCFLHRETFDMNVTVTTPLKVKEVFEARGISSPELKIMVSGDSWDSEKGFSLAPHTWFSDRENHLHAYRDRMAPVLGKFYAQEARTAVPDALVEKYFARFIGALPWIARRLFRGRHVTYVLSGARPQAYRVDLWRSRVAPVDPALVTDEGDPLQIHTSSLIFRQCMALDLFLHLGIGKRVRFRCRKADAKYHFLLELLFNLYESEMLPWRRMLAPRFVMTWMPRWREVVLYGTVLARRLRGRRFVMADYLRPPPRRR